MKFFSTIKFILLAAVLTGWGFTVGAEEMGDKSASGRISDINLEEETVVVEVPIANNQLLTVGGPVTEEASLLRRGRTADLEDFREGQWVQVTWEKTDETLLIKGLAEK